MMHRLREAMRTGGLAPIGGSGKVVEADETYFGKTEEQQTVTTRSGRPFKSKRIGAVNKRAVLALVERGGTQSCMDRGAFAMIDRIRFFCATPQI